MGTTGLDKVTMGAPKSRKRGGSGGEEGFDGHIRNPGRRLERCVVTVGTSRRREGSPRCFEVLWRGNTYGKGVDRGGGGNESDSLRIGG